MKTCLRAHRIPTGDAVRYWVDETCWAEIQQPDPRIETRLGWAKSPFSRDGLVRGLASPERQQLDGLLDLFDEHGLCVDEVGRSAMSTIHVAVAGSGRLARGIAQGLLRAGGMQLTCHDPARPDRTIWGQGTQISGGQAMAHWLRPRHHVRVRALHDVAAMARAEVDLVVVAPDRAEADRVLLSQLTRHDLPHLVVGCHGDIGRIGPLVLPGRTPCVTCHDLALGVTDPAWPRVLAHLCRMRTAAHPAMENWIAARTVLEVGWMARSLGSAEHLVGCVEFHDLQHPRPRRSTFGDHDDCGCCWSPV
ncbi:hypothetical protein ACTQ49_00635 [Luteococcus sp. Sow4_B9]|uniref:hypothetical protein n=1 Tax=Luteococcus sp. Sow4_B9 TaxID=3438792 RepID=UPI003F9D3F8F